MCRATGSPQQLWQTRNKEKRVVVSAQRGVTWRHLASQQRTHSMSALTLPSHRHTQRTRLQQQPRLTRTETKRFSKRALCFVWPQRPCRALHVLHAVDAALLLLSKRLHKRKAHKDALLSRATLRLVSVVCCGCVAECACDVTAAVTALLSHTA